MKKDKLSKQQSILITNPYNIFYLTGFRGLSPKERESFLLLFKNKKYLILSQLYEEEGKLIKNKNSSIDVIVCPKNLRMFDCLKNLFKKLRVKNLGFESKNLTFAEHHRLKTLLRGVKLTGVENFIEEQRIIKTAEEIKNIKKAQEISKKAFRQIQKLVVPGQTEAQISEKLISILKSLGAEDISFKPIVAFGKNSALPHYKTGNTKIMKNSALLLDFGAKYKGYCGDITRMIFIGEPSRRWLTVYNTVEKAQKAAIKNISIGKSSGEILNSAINIFEKEKFSKYFIHNLGHGIGLQVHEDPSIRGGEETILKKNMVFSIEPGLYFPGWGGIRIEDLVAVGKKEAEIL